MKILFYITIAILIIGFAIAFFDCHLGTSPDTPYKEDTTLVTN